MLFWKNILEMMIAGLNVMYLISLAITYFYYPSSPIRDFESDEIVGHTDGLTKWHIFMIIPFNLVNRWSYQQINKANEVGTKSGIGLDLFGVNILVMVLYSYSNKALKIYWIVPLYALYKFVNFVRPYCCPPKGEATG